MFVGIGYPAIMLCAERLAAPLPELLDELLALLIARQLQEGRTLLRK
jgi:hypothetical protein